jgi:hypothetical protein
MSKSLQYIGISIVISGVSVDKGSSSNSLNINWGLLISDQLKGGCWVDSRVTYWCVDIVISLGELELASGSWDSGIDWLIRANLEGGLGYSGDQSWGGDGDEYSTTTTRDGDFWDLVFSSSGGGFSVQACELSAGSNNLREGGNLALLTVCFNIHYLKKYDSNFKLLSCINDN